MSIKHQISGAGFLASAPKIETSKTGKEFLIVQIGEKERVRAADGTWSDGDRVFHRALITGTLATWVEQHLVKGDPLIFSGALSFSNYTTGQRTNHQLTLEISHLAPDPRRIPIIIDRTREDEPTPPPDHPVLFDHEPREQS